ncbi:MAG: hypothetical protein IT289_01835 [Oligoflexia bacterium]|nr:hypothetical protein [Oligoflexia bacterium]
MSKLIIFSFFMTFALLLPFTAQEWTFIDDTGFYRELKSNLDAHGPALGPIKNFFSIYEADKGWGLFRPGWWIYSSTIYSLSAYQAHLVRNTFYSLALTFFLMLAFKLEDDRKRKTILLGVTALCYFASRALFEGVYFTSLQELTALVPLALGFFVYFTSSSATAQFIGWILVFSAAFFKAPFVWSAILLSLLWLFKSPRRMLGLFGLLCGCALIFVISDWVKSGAYTARYNPLNLAKIIQSTKELSRPIFYGFMTLLFATLALRPKPKIQNPKLFETGLVLILAGGLYFANIAPWGAVGYYFGPCSVLMLVGFGFVLCSLESRKVTRAGVAFLALSFLFASASVFKGLSQNLKRDRSVRALRDWTSAHPGAIISMNAEEASVRLAQIVILRNPSWEGKVTFTPYNEKPQADAQYSIQWRENPVNFDYCDGTVLHAELAEVCALKR